jgi:hypothetical protein
MPPLRTGLLSFGLVSIPVQLYSATKDQRIAFNLLHAKCGSRIQNRYYCPMCNVVVERDDRIRGYELTKDQYVQLTETELESLEAESSNNIELKEFIPLSKIHAFRKRGMHAAISGKALIKPSPFASRLNRSGLALGQDTRKGLGSRGRHQAPRGQIGHILV